MSVRTGLRVMAMGGVLSLAGLSSGAQTYEFTDPWGCPVFDACVDGPAGGYQPPDGSFLQNVISILPSGIDEAPVGGPVLASNFESVNSNISEIQFPGIWTYFSTVPGRQGMKVNGTEYNLIDTTSNPISYELGSTFNEVIDMYGNRHSYAGVFTDNGEISPRLFRIDYAGGGKLTLSYDARGNRTLRTYEASDDSSLISIEAHFPDACGNMIFCNKPEWTEDARDNRTDYEYDPVHGGVTKVTKPADNNGVRPQVRYYYEQRYAWLKTSAGGYARASAPVWVLTQEEYCRTTVAVGNGCGGGASDEVVTTYDYGPDAGPNNLWLLGKTVTSEGESLTTCYTYNVFGDLLSETTPNANLSACS